VWDTDGDGVADVDEVATGTDPLDPARFPGGTEETTLETASDDSDADRLADADEAVGRH
jgi:hypothetical protein